MASAYQLAYTDTPDVLYQTYHVLQSRTSSCNGRTAHPRAEHWTSIREPPSPGLLHWLACTRNETCKPHLLFPNAGCHPSIGRGSLAGDLGGQGQGRCWPAPLPELLSSSPRKSSIPFPSGLPARLCSASLANQPSTRPGTRKQHGRNVAAGGGYGGAHIDPFRPPPGTGHDAIAGRHEPSCAVTPARSAGPGQPSPEEEHAAATLRFDVYANRNNPHWHTPGGPAPTRPPPPMLLTAHPEPGPRGLCRPRPGSA